MNIEILEKEIRLAGKLVMPREAWEQRSAVYHGSTGNAAKECWFTARSCEFMGAPVTDEELQNCNDFAMYKDCSGEHYFPVFYRSKKDIWVHIQRKRPDGTWGESFESGPLSTAELLMRVEPGKFKIERFVK